MTGPHPSALALDGAQPVRDTLLEFSPPVIGDDVIESVVATLRSGWLTSGPRALELEERFAAYVGMPHAIATASCTAALHLALIAAGVGPGDEVVTSSITWPATVNSILHTGATPVFADVEPHTLTLDPDAFEAACTKRTRAVVPVHLAGAPCAMDDIERIARARGIAIVEDAAHAVETWAGDRKVGSIGDFTCFSLYATKSLAGGEGGLITTASPASARRLRRLRAQGITRDTWERHELRTLGHYDVEEPGYKAGLSDLHAAAALPRIQHLEEFWERRVTIVDRYDAAVGRLPGISPPGRPQTGRHAHHLYVMRIDPAAAGADRDRYARALLAENISTGLHFLPVHTLTWYRRNLPPVTLPVTETAGASVLSLPLAAGHTSADVDDVIAALGKVHAAFTGS
ncbi:MAG: DegT/DnrJ/EryC1/StrS family aminotransferase [Gaiellales bacterium]